MGDAMVIDRQKDSLNEQKKLMYEQQLKNLAIKMALQQTYLFDINWFKFINNQVIMSVYRIYDTEASIYVPNFVDLLVIQQSDAKNTVNNIKSDIAINKLIICGSNLKKISAKNIRVQTLHITGIKHITSSMFQSIEAVDKLIIGSDTVKIQSYALCVDQSCLVDIRSIKSLELDSNFLHIHKATKRYDSRLILDPNNVSKVIYNRVQERIKKKCEILCTPEQYRYLQNLKPFKYKKNLKIYRT